MWKFFMKCAKTVACRYSNLIDGLKPLMSYRKIPLSSLRVDLKLEVKKNS